jgi:hypothetical protein
MAGERESAQLALGSSEATEEYRRDPSPNEIHGCARREGTGKDVHQARRLGPIQLQRWSVLEHLQHVDIDKYRASAPSRGQWTYALFSYWNGC